MLHVRIQLATLNFRSKGGIFFPYSTYLGGSRAGSNGKGKGAELGSTAAAEIGLITCEAVVFAALKVGASVTNETV
jgi:hypothetical protein